MGSADALSVEFAGTPAELGVESVARGGAEVITSTVPVPPCVSMDGAAFTVAGPVGGGTPPSRSDDTVGGKLTGLGGGGPAGSMVVLGAPVKMLRPAGGAFAPEISTSESSISSLDRPARRPLPVPRGGGGVLDASRPDVRFGVSAMSIRLTSYLNLKDLTALKSW